MNMCEYQKLARKTAIYPDLGNNFIYPVLGLCGETGEIAEKIKKIIRDKKGVVSGEDKVQIEKELGDVLWYISNVASELGMSLETIVQNNVKKLQDRQNRNMLRGSGDNR